MQQRRNLLTVSMQFFNDSFVLISFFNFLGNKPYASWNGYILVYSK